VYGLIFFLFLGISFGSSVSIDIATTLDSSLLRFLWVTVCLGIQRFGSSPIPHSSHWTRVTALIPGIPTM